MLNITHHGFIIYLYPIAELYGKCRSYKSVLLGNVGVGSAPAHFNQEELINGLLNFFDGLASANRGSVI